MTNRHAPVLNPILARLVLSGQAYIFAWPNSPLRHPRPQLPQSEQHPASIHVCFVFFSKDLVFRHVPVQTGGAGFDREPQDKVQELVARYIISMKAIRDRENARRDCRN